MQTSLYNEAIITAMLAASYSSELHNTQTEADEADITQADILLHELVALLDRAEKNAALSGLHPEMIEISDFAVCALIDEVLLSSPLWQGKTEWMKRPLQFVRHHCATAGETFYELLDSLIEKYKELAVEQEKLVEKEVDPLISQDSLMHLQSLLSCLSLFALCLAQGFTGKYYDEPQKIRQKLDEIGELIPLVGHRNSPFFLHLEEKGLQKPQNTFFAHFFRRFDFLDIALWSLPPLVLIALYTAYSSQIAAFFQSLLPELPLP